MGVRGRSALVVVVPALVVVVLGFAALVLSASDIARAGDRDSAVNAIIKSLAPIRGQTTGPAVPDAARRRVEPGVEGETIIVLPDWAVDLEVYFDFDSADLTPRAEAQLAALGAALASPALTPFRYLVAGHTDARGDDLHNIDLSLRRARAVRDYLVEAFPIDPHRLKVIGFGEQRLKRPHTPFAAINRRVEVVLIAPPSAPPPTGLAPPPRGSAVAIEPPAPQPAVAPADAPPLPAPAERDPDAPGLDRDAAGQPRVRW